MKIFHLKIFLMLFLTFVKAKKDMCGQAHSLAGMDNIMCEAFMQQWSYDASSNTCVEFIYGGCGGNDNRFGTKKDCEAACKDF